MKSLPIFGLFSTPTMLSFLHVQALSGYGFAIHHLNVYAQTDPEASFRLGLVYLFKKEPATAHKYFEITKILEMNLEYKHYTNLIDRLIFENNNDISDIKYFSNKNNF